MSAFFVFMNESELKKSIIRTLCYFDIFGHPLTADELYNFLFAPSRISYQDFLRAMEKMNLNSKFGYYFLEGRECVVENRRRRAPFVDKKLKIARRAARAIKYVPFVRAMFVCNNVSFEISDAESDIDVLMIVKSGRIWIARLLTTVLFSILMLRRTKKKITDRICLSFYLSDRNLNLANIVLKDTDIYMVYWLAQLFPVYDPDNLASSMRSANKWIENFVPNLSCDEFMEKTAKDNLPSRIIKKFFHIAWGGAYGDVVEKQAKEIQVLKMRMNKASVQDKNDTRVVINDNMLKFHENDRRELFRGQWYEKCKQYGV